MIGYDFDDKKYDGWRKQIFDRDREDIAFTINKAISLNIIKISNEFQINEEYLKFLCYKTQFRREFIGVDLSNLGDHSKNRLRLLLLLSSFFGCGELSCELVSCKDCSAILLQGTNLYIDTGSLKSSHVNVSTTKTSIVVGGSEYSAINEKERVVFSGKSKDDIHLLPIDSNFIYFYFASSTTESFEDARTLIQDTKEISEYVTLSNKIMSLLGDCVPNVYKVIKSQIVYLNFSSIEYMDSSTDLREAKGSVLLNPRFNKTEDINEIVAWSAQGLYHESKHWQFFDTYQYDGQPGQIKKDEERFSVPHDVIPCSWKSAPSARTLDDHLLAMQAFMPGMILAMQLLNSVDYFSDWLKERVELEMRSINGAISTLIIGKHLLKEDGRNLLTTLLHDYHEHLIPAYENIQAKAEC